jgi:hypothetical protein
MEQLKAEELEEARAGRTPLVEGKMTAAAFIKAGLQIEEAQYVHGYLVFNRETNQMFVDGVSGWSSRPRFTSPQTGPARSKSSASRCSRSSRRSNSSS